ncbi:MAG TPA: crosslink repair DNA glycosylase YcaQ family protein [Bryobacteraceae bacterium]
MSTQTLSLVEARRIALASLGFARKRPARPSAKDMSRVIRELGLLQIDSVNVLIPAHYLVVFSRLGPYDRTVLDKLIYSSGRFTERWAHVASIVPVESWPLLRHRMEEHSGQPWGHGEFVEQYPQYLDWVLEEVRVRGPLYGEDLPPPEGAPKRLEGSWYSNVGRAMLEAHFARGLLAVTKRGANFAREFDLTERVIAVEHLTRVVPKKDAQRELVRQAATAYGIATIADLADYFRMTQTHVKACVADLIDAGELERVKVEGWAEAAYLHSSARLPAKQISASALLSPFDPVVWFRRRAERLFDFHYRIEIYTPEAKRKFGYYVLPFLSGERLAARVDLKADRANSTLRVQAAHLEAHSHPLECAPPLMNELQQVAKWLGLSNVEIGRRGKLAPVLRRL